MAKTAVRVKKTTKSPIVKFKVRCSRHLYTLILKDSEKADKLKASLPTSTFYPHFAKSHTPATSVPKA